MGRDNASLNPIKVLQYSQVHLTQRNQVNSLEQNKAVEDNPRPSYSVYQKDQCQDYSKKKGTSCTALGPNLKNKHSVDECFGTMGCNVNEIREWFI